MPSSLEMTLNTWSILQCQWQVSLELCWHWSQEYLSLENDVNLQAHALSLPILVWYAIPRDSSDASGKHEARQLLLLMVYHICNSRKNTQRFYLQECHREPFCWWHAVPPSIRLNYYHTAEVFWSEWKEHVKHHHPSPTTLGIYNWVSNQCMAALNCHDKAWMW